MGHTGETEKTGKQLPWCLSVFGVCPSGYGPKRKSCCWNLKKNENKFLCWENERQAGQRIRHLLANNHYNHDSDYIAIYEWNFVDILSPDQQRPQHPKEHMGPRTPAGIPSFPDYYTSSTTVGLIGHCLGYEFCVQGGLIKNTLFPGTQQHPLSVEVLPQ